MIINSNELKKILYLSDTPLDTAHVSVSNMRTLDYVR